MKNTRQKHDEKGIVGKYPTANHRKEPVSAKLDFIDQQLSPEVRMKGDGGGHKK